MKRLILLALLAVTPALATDRYVGTSSASDTGGCTNSATPCATVNYCVGQMANNDRCIVQAGTYTNVSVSRNAAGAMCTVGCSIEGSGTVQINYTAGLSISHAWDMLNWNNLTIKNFSIHVQSPGISNTLFYMSNCTNCYVQDVHVLHANNVNDIRSLTWQSSNNTHTIRYSYLPDTPCQMNCGSASQACGTTSGNGSSSCDFACYSDQFTIDGGDTHLVESSSWGYGRNPGAIRNARNVTVRKSDFHNCINHSCLQTNEDTGVLYENNVYSEDTTAACQAATAGGYASSFVDSYCVTNLTVRYNTFIGHSTGHAYPTAGYVQLQGGSGNDVCVNPHVYNNVAIYGNLIYDTTGSGTYSDLTLKNGAGYTINPPLTTGYNLMSLCTSGNTHCVQYGADGDPAPGSYYTCGSGTFGWSNATVGGAAQGVGDVCLTPTFVSYTNGTNFASNNYRPLNATSPQVNAGSTSADATFPCPIEDHDGNPRGGANGRCDIGAFEFQAAGGGPVCGNNIKETGEACDGTDLNGQTCASQVAGSIGTLTCNLDCTFNTSGCTVAPSTSATAKGVQLHGATIH